MKLKKLIGSLCIVTLCANGCGAEKESVSPDMAVSPNKVYFLTSDHQDSSSLYSINTNNNSIQKEVSPLLEQDTSGFALNDASGNLRTIYLTERLKDVNQPSRGTVFDLNGNLNQNTNMPRNVYDMQLQNQTLYSLGYDENELSSTSPNFNSVSLAPTTIYPRDDKSVFSALLLKNNELYILTSNWVDQKKQASILHYNSQNIKTLLNSFPIDGINSSSQKIMCYNINSTIKVNSQKIIIACNPRYFSGDSSNISIFSIDVSSGSPIPSLLTQKSKCNHSSCYFTLGGMSQDKNYVLVTEEDYDDYKNPTVDESYWFSLNGQTPTKIPTTGAFDVSYNLQTHTYVFSCYLNENHCQNNAFGVANNVTSGLPTNIQPISTEVTKNLLGIRGLKFFKELQSSYF